MHEEYVHILYTVFALHVSCNANHCPNLCECKFPVIQEHL